LGLSALAHRIILSSAHQYEDEAAVAAMALLAPFLEALMDQTVDYGLTTIAIVLSARNDTDLSHAGVVISLMI
jgi:hypothetical protein